MKFSENEKYSAKKITFSNAFKTAPKVTVNFFNSKNEKIDITDVKTTVETDGFTLTDFTYTETDETKIPVCFTWIADGDFVDEITDKDTAKDYAYIGSEMLVTGKVKTTGNGTIKVIRDDTEIYTLDKNAEESVDLKVNDILEVPDSETTLELKGISLSQEDTKYRVTGLNSRFSVTCNKAVPIDLGRTGTFEIPSDVGFKITRDGAEFNGKTVLADDVITLTNNDAYHNIDLELSKISFKVPFEDTAESPVSREVQSVEDGFIFIVNKTQRAKTILIDEGITVSIQRSSEIIATLTNTSPNSYDFQSGDILVLNKGTVTGSGISIFKDENNYTLTNLSDNYKLQVKATGTQTTESGKDTSKESGNKSTTTESQNKTK